jgi:hypothetical protein
MIGKNPFTATTFAKDVLDLPGPGRFGSDSPARHVPKTDRIPVSPHLNRRQAASRQ